MPNAYQRVINHIKVLSHGSGEVEKIIRDTRGQILNLRGNVDDFLFWLEERDFTPEQIIELFKNCRENPKILYAISMLFPDNTPIPKEIAAVIPSLPPEIRDPSRLKQPSMTVSVDTAPVEVWLIPLKSLRRFGL